MSNRSAAEESGTPERSWVDLRSPGLVFRVAVSIGLLSVMFWWLPVGQIMSGVSSVPLWVWLVCLCGFGLGHIIAALKWRVLLRGAGVRTDQRLVLKAHSAGLFANLCLPSIVGGDFIRATMVIKETGKIEQVTIASLADRLIDTLVLLIIALLGLALFPDQYLLAATESFRHIPLIISVCLTFLTTVVVGIGLLSSIPEQCYPQKLRRVVAKFRAAFGALYAAPSTALIALVLSIVIQCGFVLLNVLLAHGVGISVSVLIWFAVWPLAKLVALVPISLGGIGVREATLMSLLVPFGVSSSAAVAQALSWQAVLWATGLIAGTGIALLAYYSRSKNSVRQVHQGE